MKCPYCNKELDVYADKALGHAAKFFLIFTILIST